MKERHALFVVVEDETGRRGVGENWVNFPFWSPWERAAAFEHAFAPYLQGREAGDIPSFILEMYRAFVGPALQSGTVGPLLGALCAVELALWDLDAQAAGLPLSRHLFDDPKSSVHVYASGLNSPIPWELVDAHLDRGVALFKLKLGFGAEEDRANVQALKKRLGERAALAVDVNRSWTFKEAVNWLPMLRDHDVQWLEEPLEADEEFRLEELRGRSAVPIAGGENVMMPPDADVEPMADGPFDVLQPDLTKYCPLHVARALLPAARRKGKDVVPHFLGSGPGQAASLHFASGCERGLVELDISRNPLRTDLVEPGFDIEDGCIRIPDDPGMGWRLTSFDTHAGSP
jgi:L-alanine-DL-glutamate epimerase-like enolase superfamily enzyme